jgi:hypothetical protein
MHAAVSAAISGKQKYDIAIQDTCSDCGTKRSGNEVFLKCQCTRNRHYPAEIESTILSELTILEGYRSRSIYSLAELDTCITYLGNIRAETKRLIANSQNAQMFRRISNAMHEYRTDILPTLLKSNISSRSNEVDMAMRIIFIKPSIAQLIGHECCLFAHDISCPCTNRCCDVFCQAHTGWMYIASNELTCAMTVNIAQICIEFIYPWHREVNSCIPSVPRRHGFKDAPIQQKRKREATKTTEK